MDLARAPSAELGAAVEEDFHEAQHAGVSGGDGESQALEQREVEWTSRAWASN